MYGKVDVSSMQPIWVLFQVVHLMLLVLDISGIEWRVLILF
jgi:hypothetical protein